MEEIYRIELSGVAYRDGRWWVAHCLEMDVVAEGDSPLEALKEMVALCGLKIEDAIREGDVRSIFNAAPPQIWELHARGEQKETAGPLPRSVSRFDTRALELV